MQWLAAAVLMVLFAPVAHATEGVVVGDAYVNSLRATTNYGSLSNLYVNSTGTTLIQFDLSSLPAGTTANQIGSASPQALCEPGEQCGRCECAADHRYVE